MPDRKITCALLLAVFAIACVRTDPGKDGCKTVSRPLSEHLLRVRLDPYLEMGGRVHLIGCESDLKRIGPAEKAKLVPYFRSVFVENHYFLSRRLSEDEGFRRKLVADVNRILGRKLVTGVLIKEIYSTEFAPG